MSMTQSTKFGIVDVLLSIAVKFSDESQHGNLAHQSQQMHMTNCCADYQLILLHGLQNESLLRMSRQVKSHCMDYQSNPHQEVPQ